MKMLSVHSRRRRYDPTRTLTLRNAFVAAIRRRYVKIRKKIRAIVLEEMNSGVGEDWFKYAMERIHKIVDEELAGKWSERYIKESYAVGMRRGRIELRAAGYDIPAMTPEEKVEIRQELVVNVSMAHLRRSEIVAAKTAEYLKDRSAQISSVVSERLSDGMLLGRHPREVARELDGVLYSEMYKNQTFARTEMIRAHHLGTIEEYRTWEAEGVYVQGEFRTAGDDRVCKRCEDYEADADGVRREYTVDEIEPLIPVHQNCRCIALPVSARRREAKTIKEDSDDSNSNEE